MPTLDENLHQLATDFEELARYIQAAIEAVDDDYPALTRLHFVRNRAHEGARLARRALGGSGS